MFYKISSKKTKSSVNSPAIEYRLTTITHSFKYLSLKNMQLKKNAKTISRSKINK